MENRFNLIDENWIPVTGRGRVSLRTAFSDSSLSGLGGNPVEKISLFKLLLAIAQSACTPKDEAEWEALGTGGLQSKVLSYLDEHYDCFWLYGEKPFLQMPEVKNATIQPYGAVQLEIATGNTSLVTEIQKEKRLTDAEKTVLLISLMGFAAGGKKTDNSIVLTPGYSQKSNDKGRPSTGKPGPSLAYMGLAHSFFLCETLMDSVYINLLSEEQIQNTKMFSAGIGIAPWLRMPKGEDDDIAGDLKRSLMGRLVPLCRFVLFADSGIHYTEGLLHPNYESFVIDPSVTVSFETKPKPKVIWIDVERKPWRQLTSFLSFLNVQSQTGFICPQLQMTYPRLHQFDSFSLWCGGVKVSSNAGEQYLTGADDYVESEVEFSSDLFTDEDGFYNLLSQNMDYLDKIAKVLYGCVSKYYSVLTKDGQNIAAQATGDFWQLAEGLFQKLIDACESDSSGNQAKVVRKSFNSIVLQMYDQYCPHDSARQLEAWAQCKPRLKNEKEEA